MTAEAPIRFAILGEIATLAQWQARCVERLQRVAQLVPLREGDLDFILAWGPGAGGATDAAGATDTGASGPAPNLLAAARYGVWRYQFGDWVNYRGEPAGFWEVHERQSVSAVMLIRVQPEGDSVVVLREAYVRTHLLSAAGNRRQLQQRCADWAAHLCVDIRNGMLEQFTARPRRSTAVVRTAPTRLQRIVHMCRIATRLGLAALRDLFRHEQWNVGVVDQPIAAFLRASSRATTSWLPAPRVSEIRADPFGAVRNGNLTVLCEYLDFKDNRGVIVAIEPDTAKPRAPDTPVAIGPAPPVHLSYPYLLEVDGRILCIPETHEAREIALYEAEHFPDRWKRLTTLVSDTVTVDASAFRHGDTWWLAGSEAAPKGANCELHLWHAAAITGPWQPHPGNPVKIDVRSARPGGTPFVHDGVLYRPAQDCSKTYGGRIVINRVLTLTPTAFQEEFAVAVDPDTAGPYPHGLHTLSAVGNVTLIDGKRIRFVPAQFGRALRSWLGIFLKRRAAHD